MRLRVRAVRTGADGRQPLEALRRPGLWGEVMSGSRARLRRYAEYNLAAYYATPADEPPDPDPNGNGPHDDRPGKGADKPHPNCDHDGQLVEVPTLGEVQCTRCGHMAPLVEKHLR